MAVSEPKVLNLVDNQRQVFLARLSHDLTIHGRSFGLDLAGEVQVKSFQGAQRTSAPN